LYRFIRISIILLVVPVQLYPQNIDIRILRSVYSPEIKASDDFFRFISNSDTYVVLGVPVTMAVIGAVRHDRNALRNSLVLLGSAGLNEIITEALKYTINRDRPFITYPDIVKKADAGSPSFPSGHTSSAFSMAVSVSLADPEWYIIAPSFAYAGTVAWSRMHLGVHYPSDVLAGALIGAGSAYVTYRVNKILFGKRRNI